VSYDYDPASDGASMGVIVNMSGSAITIGSSTVTDGHALDGWGTTDTLSGFEKVFGSHFNDVLLAGAGNNTLTGGQGNDTLMGGGGSDILTGGAGSDLFVYKAIMAEAGDSITDFTSGTDKFGFVGSSSGGVVPYNTTAELTGHVYTSEALYNASGTSTDSCWYRSDANELVYDMNGHGTAGGTYVIAQGVTSLATADIVIVDSHLAPI